MSWDRIEGNWEMAKGKVREMWGKLTNDDLDVIKGRRQQLSGKLQERYGYVKDKAEEEINRFLKRYPSDDESCGSCKSDDSKDANSEDSEENIHQERHNH